MRNALGHGNISINVPHDLDYRKDEFDFEKRTTVKFYDEDQRDSSDIFEIEISIEGLSMLVKKFQGIAYREIIKDRGARGSDLIIDFKRNEESLTLRKPPDINRKKLPRTKKK